MEQGWIKISRSITNHWIWKDPIKFKWWMDMLLMANFEPKRVSIGYKVFECKRGECLMSLKSWGARWGVSKTVVNNFFTMLENDNMIKTVNETVTTRLTICNYDSYQQNENESKTHLKRIKNATEPQQSTTKEGEEREERKEEYIKNEFEKFRLLYGGKKRGLETELEHFKKKYSNYEEILPLLYPAVEKLIAWRKRKAELSQWVSEYPNMQTWINQKRWEEEFETTKEVKQSPKLNYT